MTRSWRAPRALATASAFVLASTTILLPAVAGSAVAGQRAEHGTAGYCPTGSGVTVVVDLQQLGGGIVVRCAPGPVTSGFTGLDALRQAGFSPQGVAQWGLAFVCRIADRPAPDEDIAVDGDPHYRETCQNTPPAAAFWSYWYAGNGGDWTFSQTAAKERDVIKGGFEGWSFSLNHAVGDAPAPRLSPTRPVHRPPHTPPPTRPPTHPPSTGPSTAPTTPTAPTMPTAPTTPATGSPATSVPRTGTHTGDRSTAVAPPGGPTGGPGGTDPVAVGHNKSGVKVTGALPPEPAQAGGLSASVLIGLCLVAVLAAGAALTGWRRRRG